MKHANHMGEVAVGGALAFAIIFFLPIVDILELFIYMVLVPVIFLAALGVMSHGTYEMIRDFPATWRQVASDLKERTNAARVAREAPRETVNVEEL